MLALSIPLWPDRSSRWRTTWVSARFISIMQWHARMAGPGYFRTISEPTLRYLDRRAIYVSYCGSLVGSGADGVSANSREVNQYIGTALLLKLFPMVGLNLTASQENAVTTRLAITVICIGISYDQRIFWPFPFCPWKKWFTCDIIDLLAISLIYLRGIFWVTWAPKFWWPCH